MGLFKGYERPEGSESDHVDLLVRENVIEKYGIPAVDFDNLSRMYSDDLGLQAGKWTVKLFDGNWSGHVDRPASKLSLGYHVLGTRTIHSAVWSGGYHFSLGHGPEQSKVDGTDTMRKLIRQSVGVAEGRTQPLTLAKERAKLVAPYAITFGALTEVGAPAALVVGLSAAVGALSIQAYNNQKSWRREAREVAIHAGHQSDIIFPTSPYA